ncbi:PP0621 family protein [Ramlibacter sp.]|uniref:PP0621 family protein n=1 Tax=Ramlibacter sp. TaxID=1917967 RepID=UPI002608FC44|nr:PP0621 family protein [Ramlibacter sp.]MDB5953562.1 hypothetical protein [Ramlibacter sp.]
MIMKYLLLFAVLFIAYMMWRNKRIDNGDAAARRGPAQRPLAMVSCQVCGVHLPKPDAVIGSDGLFYCSQEHRQRAGRQ